MPEQKILTWAANRAANEPSLLAYDLSAYRALNNVSEGELALALQCSPEALVCLSLCRRPNPNAATFRSDIQQIATHCGVNARNLAAVLREVDSLRTMREASAIAPFAQTQLGFLAAARDRNPHPRPRKPGGKKGSGKKRPRK